MLTERYTMTLFKGDLCILWKFLCSVKSNEDKEELSKILIKCWLKYSKKQKKTLHVYPYTNYSFYPVASHLYHSSHEHARGKPTEKNSCLMKRVQHHCLWQYIGNGYL